jgi:putative DNA-invertase from lambdoid prophage Rac
MPDVDIVWTPRGVTNRVNVPHPDGKLSFMAGLYSREGAMKNQGLGAGMWTGFLARDTGMMKLGCDARVSTHDQHTLTLQRDAMAAYAQQRGWSIVHMVTEIGSGVSERRQREQLMRAARRRDIDAIVVWRLDRWGRSLADLVGTLQELHALGVGFISLRETLDFTTPAGRAMAGLLAIFAEFEREILRERVKAGIAQARRHGKRHGRPPRIAYYAGDVQRL